MSRAWITMTVMAGALWIGACMKVPPPTQEEIYARDQWAAQVTEKDRQQVYDLSHMHTGWSEKRRIQFELLQFQKLANKEDREKRWQEEKQRKAATQMASTRAATGPTTRRKSTRTGTGRPGEETE